MKRRKFYVWSDNLRVVILAETPRFAALCALDLYGKLDGTRANIYVGERGFESTQSSGLGFETVELWNELVTEIGEN